MKKRVRALLSVLFLAALLMNFMAIYANAEEATTAPTAAVTDAAATVAPTAAPTAAAAFDGNYSGEYHAYMGIQTDTKLWIFRNSYDDANYGFGTEQFKGLASVSTDPSAKPAYDGTFTDAVIDGDGTYTVTLENPDFADETHLSLLFVSTDIPLSDKVKFTNISAKFDGSTKYTFESAENDKDSKTNFRICLLNQWNTELKDLFTYPMPFKKVEITFTITGLGYESAAQAAAAAATPTVAPAAADTSANDTAATTDTDSAAASTSTADDTDGGLSTGVIIGIAAGAVVIIVVVVLVVLAAKKKKS